MAVIKNEKTGCWEVRTYYKDILGNRKQKTKRGFAKKSEALDWERSFKLQQDNDLNMSFEDFYKIYLEDISARIKENSTNSKVIVVEKKILPFFGKKPINSIKSADVRKWQTELLNMRKSNGEKYSPTYIKTIHAQLSAIFNHAVDFYGLSSNPARKAGTIGKLERIAKMFANDPLGAHYELREQSLKISMENEALKQENRQLRHKLEQAYEFMKQFTIKGKTILEMFLEKMEQVVERVFKR